MTENIKDVVRRFTLGTPLQELLALLAPEQITEATLAHLIGQVASANGFVIASADRPDRVERRPDGTGHCTICGQSDIAPKAVVQHNAMENNKLREKLKSLLGYGFVPVYGSWIDDKTGERADEQSYFKSNVTHEEARRIAQVMTAAPFSQQSVLWGNGDEGYFLLRAGGETSIGKKVSSGQLVDYFTSTKKGMGAYGFKVEATRLPREWSSMSDRVSWHLELARRANESVRG